MNKIVNGDIVKTLKNKCHKLYNFAASAGSRKNPAANKLEILVNQYDWLKSINDWQNYLLNQDIVMMV